MSGEFTRYWNRLKGLQVTPIVDRPVLHKTQLTPPPDPQIARPDPVTDPELTKTTILPAVSSTGRQANQDGLPFYEFQSYENPLVMLFGAVVASSAHFKRIPAALFIPSVLLPALRRDTEALTGRPYDGHFRFYCPGAAIDGKVKALPVFTEELLPDLLKIIFNGRIGRDRVIAIAEV